LLADCADYQQIASNLCNLLVLLPNNKLLLPKLSLMSACTVLLYSILAASRKLFTRGGFAHQLLSAMAYAYAVAIPDGSNHPVCMGFPFVSTAMACRPIQFVRVPLSFRR
jgi:hypothetical protein